MSTIFNDFVREIVILWFFILISLQKNLKLIVDTSNVITKNRDKPYPGNGSKDARIIRKRTNIIPVSHFTRRF